MQSPTGWPSGGAATAALPEEAAHDRVDGRIDHPHAEHEERRRKAGQRQIKIDGLQFLHPIKVGEVA